ncbi:MAG: NifU N-terminal domain-containing protein, partial [bacterium]
MLVPEGMSFDFPTPTAAENAPLAQELFMYPFVDRVFYASNFVTVTKKEEVEWIEIQETLKKHIQGFLESGKLILDMKAPAAEEQEETETIKKIKSHFSSPNSAPCSLRSHLRKSKSGKIFFGLFHSAWCKFSKTDFA